MKKILIENLHGRKTDKIPLWIMRQAGRYLPEYKKTRAQAGSFLKVCYTPALATEVTLQPIRRFDFDASIVFSDILVIPDALGQKVEFKEGVGPLLNPIQTIEELIDLEKNIHTSQKYLNPVYETIDRLKTALPKATTLIGFAGSPWTVATYMIMGKGKQDKSKIIEFCHQNPEFFSKLLDILIESTANHLVEQVKAGAEVLQIFDSWAGALSEDEFEKWSIIPNAKIIEKVRKVFPTVPIIGFPKGAGEKIPDFITKTKCNGIGIDHHMDLDFVQQKIQPLCTTQGCLSPETLITGKNLEQETYEILEKFKEKPHIFNLGHGIDKTTPIENVEKLVEIVKNYRR